MNFFEFNDPNEGMQGVIKLGHESSAAPASAPAAPVKQVQGASPPLSRLNSLKGFCEVDLMTVLFRLKKTLWPFNRTKFFEDKSDLYGAIWVPTTLIFILSVSGSLATKLSHSTGYTFDPAALVTTASVIYIFLFAVPTVLSFCLFEGIPLGFIDILSLYGYSYFSFVPSSVISIARYPLLRWLSFTLSTVWSSLLIVKNFYNEIQFLDDWKKYVSIAICVSGYVALTLTANLYLFN